MSTSTARNVALCLACSSSLPRVKSASRENIFTTSCCRRPICPACLQSNPRLARYNPCLACLGGVGAVGGGIREGLPGLLESRNVDGAVRDEDTFVLGDDEDDSADETESPSPPAYPTPSLSTSAHTEETTTSQRSSPSLTNSGEQMAPPITEQLNHTGPLQYDLKPGDTIQGLALRFGVNVRPSLINTHDID